MKFNEDFLHFIWKYRLFSQKGLISASGDSLEIISTGFHNQHSGADFENAKIRINDTIWAGNVEIHLKSSDWTKHLHTTDKAYNNVVLHVVYEHDQEVLRNDGTSITTLVLKNYIPAGTEFRYQELMQNLLWIPCEKLISEIDEIHLEQWLLRVLVERLEEKTTAIFNLLHENKGSWDDTFYIILARNFGFKTNSLPFELLAKSLPQQILARHKNNPMQVEALLFGQAGFLAKVEDEYSKKLQQEYVFLQKKYQLKPIEQHLWKFLRLRPQNFPTIRLAQFSALVLKSSHLFSEVLKAENPEEISALFKNLPVNSYWSTHYRFGKETAKVAPAPGNEAIQNILLNSVVTTLFSYGKQIGNQQLVDRSLKLLESLPYETNQITRRFTQIGVKPGSACRSQALLQLKKNYCDKKKCLNCAVGAKIIR